jgi:hypothetical protein
MDQNILIHLTLDRVFESINEPKISSKVRKIFADYENTNGIFHFHNMMFTAIESFVCEVSLQSIDKRQQGEIL